MGGTELGGGAGDPIAADCCLELVYTGGEFVAVVRGEGAVVSAATVAAAAAVVVAIVAAAAARSNVQRLKSLQFGEYRAILCCLAPWLATTVALGPCLRPWRGVGTDRRTTAICQFRARRECPTSMA